MKKTCNMVLMYKFKVGDRVMIKSDDVFVVCYVNPKDGRADVFPINDSDDTSIEYLRPEYLELVDRTFQLGDVIRVRASGEILVVVMVDETEVGVYSTSDNTTRFTGSENLSQSGIYEVVDTLR